MAKPLIRGARLRDVSALVRMGRRYPIGLVARDPGMVAALRDHWVAPGRPFIAITPEDIASGAVTSTHVSLEVLSRAERAWDFWRRSIRLAFLRGRLAGLLAWSHDSGRDLVKVESLFVLPWARRRGVARALLLRMERETTGSYRYAASLRGRASSAGLMASAVWSWRRRAPPLASDWHRIPTSSDRLLLNFLWDDFIPPPGIAAMLRRWDRA